MDSNKVLNIAGLAAVRALSLLAALALGLGGCRAELPVDTGGVAADAAGPLDGSADGSPGDAAKAETVDTIGPQPDAVADVSDASAPDADALADIADSAAKDSEPSDIAADATYTDLADAGTADTADTADTAEDVGDAQDAKDTAGPDTIDPCVNMKCNDNNQCTKDSCSKGNCNFATQPGQCDDGNPCTVDDFCTAGTCVGEINGCDDSKPCTTDKCTTKSGCLHEDNDSKCDDGDACTEGDACALGACKPGAAVNCDDKNVCTNDSCDSASGCVNLANAATCNDGNNCNVDDTCDKGVCQGTGGPNCNDGNVCTDDGCENQVGCTHANNVSDCPDGDKCNGDEWCSGGACKPGSAPLCDDANACTDDSCDKVKGCVNLYNAATCDDADACTSGDVCQNGSCLGKVPTICDDANPCTDDSCDPKTGCSHTANTAPCDDGNACTEGDTCKASACAAGPPKNCSDNNECTVDACQAGGICSNTLAPAQACDDGNACTIDGCEGTSCTVIKSINDLSVCGSGMVCQLGMCKAGWANSSAWSPTQNPYGPWTYGWSIVGAGPFPTLGQLHVYKDIGYTDPPVLAYWLDKTIIGPDWVPSILVNTSNQPFPNVAPGELSLHPGAIGGDPTKPVYSVLRWTSPKSGKYLIKVRFYPGDPNRDMVGLLAINGTSTTAAPVLIPNGAVQELQAAPYLDQGATVDFSVGPNPDGTFKWGTTPVSFEIILQ